jgi:hypothetical protein
MVRRFPTEVTECVAFIGIAEPTEGTPSAFKYRPAGTAFFLEVPSERIADGRFVFLVTAKHVAVNLEGRPFGVRLNTHEGGATVATGDATVRWWLHPDPTVDIAMIQWGPPAQIKRKHIPLGMVLTEEARGASSIDVGDEVYVTGLFVHHFGTHQNQPIVRTGNIAMVPTEPVMTSIGGMRAYLIESRSIGGLSGSPVFVREPREVGFGLLRLLGVVHGHWDIPPEAKNDGLDFAVNVASAVNMGIAIVTPAERILEVLAVDELRDHLRAKEELYIRSQPEVEVSLSAQQEPVSGDGQP